MKTKNMFFLLCLGLGVMIFITSCDNKKESYNITSSMQKYLVERTDSTINIFVKNDEKKCYDSLVQFPVPKYAKITNEQIAYILDHPDEIYTEKQTIAKCWFEGVFPHYEKTKINYTIFLENDIPHQQEKILSDRSGIVWSWIIGLGLFILVMFTYFVLSCWWLIKKREMFVSNKFFNMFFLGPCIITILSILIENFLQNFWLSVLLVICVVIVYVILMLYFVIIDSIFEKIRVWLIKKDTGKSIKQNT